MTTFVAQVAAVDAEAEAATQAAQAARARAEICRRAASTGGAARPKKVGPAGRNIFRPKISRLLDA